MRNMIIGGVTLLWLALGSTAAQAAIVDQGDTTLDTGTGLEWLDLTFSLNRSFLDVSANFGMGGDFEGYRYASESEVATLWTNAGIPDVGSSSVANIDPVRDLLQLIGTTNGLDSARGMTSFEQSPGFRRIARISDDSDEFGGDAGAILFAFSVGESVAASNRGSYLVRDTISAVPLPAGLPLLLAGLGGLAILRNRKTS